MGREGTLAALAGLLILLGAGLLLPRGFWVLDESCRYLQTVSLSRDLRFPPPLDLPEENLSPLPAHYGQVREGKVYAQYGPLLALLSVPGYLAAGEAGIYLAPAVGGTILLALLYCALRRRGFSRWLAFGLSLVGSPLAFYSTTFWSHTIAAVLVLTAALMPARRLIPAMGLVGLAALFREEALIMAPLLPLMAVKRPGWKALAGLLLLLAVFLGGQLLLTGNLLGTHIAASGSGLDFYGHAGRGFLASRVYVMFIGGLSALPGLPVWASAVAGTALWALWALSRREGASSSAAFFAGLAMAALGPALILARGLRPFDAFLLKHPLVIFPLLWLVPVNRRTALAGAGAAALLLVMAPMHAEDLAWGARLLQLPLFVACLQARKRQRVVEWGVLALGVLSLAASMGLLSQRRSASATLRQFAASRGEAVITSSWILTGDLMPLTANGTPVAWTDDGRELAALMGRLAARKPVLVTDLSSSGAAISVARAAGFTPSLLRSVEIDPSLSAGVFGLRPSSAAVPSPR